MSNTKEYILPNGKKAVFEYDVCGIGKITLECMDELMGMIADRPQEWIPCSERLPKEDGRYYVTRQDYVTQTDFTDILWYEKGLWWNRQSIGDYAVIAWMPLPAPWKGASDD